MIKAQDTTTLERNFTKQVFKNPLNWCPLFGYVPDILSTHLQKTALSIAGVPVMVDHSLDSNTITAFEVALDCHDYIKEAREYWSVKRTLFNIFKYNPIPDITTFPRITDKNGTPYEYDLLGQTCKVARALFTFLPEIAWGHCCPDIKIKMFNSTRMSWPKTDILERTPDGLLHDAQEFIDDHNIATNYKLQLDELYSLCAIYESWHLIINLLNKTYSQKDGEAVLGYAGYIDKLVNKAGDELEKALLERDSSLFKKQKSGKVAVLNEVRKMREKNKGIMVATAELEQKFKKLKNAEQIYKIFFNKYRVDESLVRRLCDGEDVEKSFYEVSDAAGDTYHIYMIVDKVEPDDLHKARLYQIKNTEKRKSNKGIAFDTYRTEYFRGGKKSNKHNAK